MPAEYLPSRIGRFLTPIPQRPADLQSDFTARLARLGVSRLAHPSPNAAIFLARLAFRDAEEEFTIACFLVDVLVRDVAVLC